MNDNDLRKLLEHIDRGGKTAREFDPRTGRVVSVPVYEGDIGRKIGSTVGGIFGKSAGDRLGQIGSDIGDMFGKSGQDKPQTNAPGADKPNANGPANISDFSSGSTGSVPSGQGGTSDQTGLTDFDKQMNAKMAANKNPNGNGGHEGSGIDPNDDPEDPKTWPPGIKPAPDNIGYLDPDGMWIPTPFHVRDEAGNFNVPRTSPANRTGISNKQYTPFQAKFEKMQGKVVYSSASAIEQSKPVKLPNGAPEIPGYKQVNPSQFSTDAREPGLDKTVDWVYTYRKGNNFILIAPELFYNTKLSIGRHYRGWNHHGIKTDNDRVPSKNGTVFVANQSFNVNDMILVVVVNTSIGAGNIGPQILKSIAGSLKPL